MPPINPLGPQPTGDCATYMKHETWTQTTHMVQNPHTHTYRVILPCQRFSWACMEGLQLIEGISWRIMKALLVESARDPLFHALQSDKSNTYVFAMQGCKITKTHLKTTCLFLFNGVTAPRYHGQPQVVRYAIWCCFFPGYPCNIPIYKHPWAFLFKRNTHGLFFWK